MHCHTCRRSRILSNTAPVSQFTLLASTKKGNKPDFHRSAGANEAKALYDHFFAKVQALYSEEKVKNGVFQAMMDVALVNDGPVGVDYTCEDEQVNHPVLPCPLCCWPASLLLVVTRPLDMFADSLRRSL